MWCAYIRLHTPDHGQTNNTAVDGWMGEWMNEWLNEWMKHCDHKPIHCIPAYPYRRYTLPARTCAHVYVPAQSCIFMWIYHIIYITTTTTNNFIIIIILINYCTQGTATEPAVRFVNLQAMGKAISKAVSVAEFTKRKFNGLHQITKLESFEITDVYEPLVEGLNMYVKQHFCRVWSCMWSVICDLWHLICDMRCVTCDMGYAE